MRLSDKTCLITGAASGIGRASAVKAAEEGANVVAADIDVEGGAETVSTIEEAGGEAVFSELDVRDAEAFEAVASEAADTYGGLDVLVNVAGIELFKPFEQTTLDDLDERMQINLIGTWNGCQAALPYLKEADGGAIVNMSSISGHYGIQMQVGYGMTKAGVSSLTRALAAEVGAEGVRVNALAPGAIETPMVEEQVIGQSDHPEAVRQQFKEVSVFERYGQPEEIANFVAFVASDEASFMTGEIVTVDGGFGLF